jgi:hypothetical protein
MKYRHRLVHPPLAGDRLQSLKAHLRRCLWNLEIYGRVSREDRRRALCRWPDLADRADEAAYREALDRLPTPAMQVVIDRGGNVVSLQEERWRRR